jgi:CheY-like chemotaxis protein/two-component sensor histidine kinase
MRGDTATVGERGIIARQVAHLSRLVDDLLDVSRITRGKIELRREVVDLAGVVDKAIELAQPLLERRERPIDVEVPEQPVHVEGDAVRLAQVVSNLLTNAAKFTPEDGAIRVRVRDAGAHAEIEVDDEGCGIAPSLLPHVFDLFVQGAQMLDRQSGGLGLGLTIVKTLVHMHRGSVTAHSDGAGHGARFVVRLPRAAPAAAAAEAPDTARNAAPRRGRVLVVDDNVDAAETLAALLENEGYELRTARDGTAAFHALESFGADVAILDIGLPLMSGYEVARTLRGDPRFTHLRLIALTGYGREPDRQRALQSGFDEHLVKPVAAERLLDVIARLLD